MPVVPVGVGLAVRVALRAVGDEDGCPTAVLRRGHWFKMRWSLLVGDGLDAAAHSAEMVSLKPLGEWPYQQFIAETVSTARLEDAVPFSV